MDDLIEALRGYSNLQLSEAMLFTLVNFLKEKSLIDFDEFSKFYEEHLNDILKQVVERDKKQNEEILAKHKKENKEDD